MEGHQIVFLALWAVACGYAAVRGGAPERIVAGALVLAVIATWLSASSVAAPYTRIIAGIALTDLILFGLLVAIALVSTRFWPMLMASMQGCGLLGHLTRPLGPHILPQAYFATVAFWSFPIVILLAVATWRHRIRLARYGVDYAWVRQLPTRYRRGWSVDELTPRGVRASPAP
jgi:hypothetical protein